MGTPVSNSGASLLPRDSVAAPQPTVALADGRALQVEVAPVAEPAREQELARNAALAQVDAAANGHAGVGPGSSASGNPSLRQRRLRAMQEVIAHSPQRHNIGETALRNPLPSHVPQPGRPDPAAAKPAPAKPLPAEGHVFARQMSNHEIAGALVATLEHQDLQRDDELRTLYEQLKSQDSFDSPHGDEGMTAGYLAKVFVALDSIGAKLIALEQADAHAPHKLRGDGPTKMQELMGAVRQKLASAIESGLRADTIDSEAIAVLLAFRDRLSPDGGQTVRDIADRILRTNERYVASRAAWSILEAAKAHSPTDIAKAVQPAGQACSRLRALAGQDASDRGFTLALHDFFYSPDFVSHFTALRKILGGQEATLRRGQAVTTKSPNDVSRAVQRAIALHGRNAPLDQELACLLLVRNAILSKVPA